MFTFEFRINNENANGLTDYLVVKLYPNRQKIFYSIQLKFALSTGVLET